MGATRRKGKRHHRQSQPQTGSSSIWIQSSRPKRAQPST